MILLIFSVISLSWELKQLSVSCVHGVLYAVSEFFSMYVTVSSSSRCACGSASVGYLLVYSFDVHGEINSGLNLAPGPHIHVFFLSPK